MKAYKRMYNLYGLILKTDLDFFEKYSLFEYGIKRNENDLDIMLKNIEKYLIKKT